MKDKPNYVLAHNIVDYLTANIGETVVIDTDRLKLTSVNAKRITVTNGDGKHTYAYPDIHRGGLDLIGEGKHRRKDSTGRYANRSNEWVKFVQEDGELSGPRDARIESLEKTAKKLINEGSFDDAIPYLTILEEDLVYHPSKLWIIKNAIAYIQEHQEASKANSTIMSSEYHQVCLTKIATGPEAHAEQISAESAPPQAQIDENKRKHLASIEDLIMEFAQG